MHQVREGGDQFAPGKPWSSQGGKEEVSAEYLTAEEQEALDALKDD